MTDKDCCNNDYILGFVLGCILHVFALIVLCYRKESGLRKGIIHSVIIMSVLSLISIVIAVIVGLTYSN